MELLIIILMLIGGLTLYMRIRLNSKVPIDRLLTLVTIIITFHAIHFHIVFTYFAHRPYLEALAPFRLLYAPLIYYALHLAQIPAVTKFKKDLKIHVFPALVFTIIYIIFCFSTDLRDAYGELGFEILLFSEISSYLTYAIASIILIYKSIGHSKWYPNMRILGEVVVVLAVLSGLFSFIEFFRELEYYSVYLARAYDFNLLMLLITMLLFFILTVEQLIALDKSVEIIEPMTNKSTLHTVKIDKVQTSELEVTNNRSFENDKELADFLFKLDDLVKAEWFLDPEINLNSLAKKTKYSKHFVSKVFNETLQVNFNQYFNQLRIEYLVRSITQLVEEGAPMESIEELYNQAGFKSKSTFNRHFKNIMNQTPTEFIDSLKDHS